MKLLFKKEKSPGAFLAFSHLPFSHLPFKTQGVRGKGFLFYKKTLRLIPIIGLCFILCSCQKDQKQTQSTLHNSSTLVEDINETISPEGTSQESHTQQSVTAPEDKGEVEGHPPPEGIPEGTNQATLHHNIALKLPEPFIEREGHKQFTVTQANQATQVQEQGTQVQEQGTQVQEQSTQVQEQGTSTNAQGQHTQYFFTLQDNIAFPDLAQKIKVPLSDIQLTITAVCVLEENTDQSFVKTSQIALKPNIPIIELIAEKALLYAQDMPSCSFKFSAQNSFGSKHIFEFPKMPIKGHIQSVGLDLQQNLQSLKTSYIQLSSLPNLQIATRANINRIQMICDNLLLSNVQFLDSEKNIPFKSEPNLSEVITQKPGHIQELCRFFGYKDNILMGISKLFNILYHQEPPKISVTYNSHLMQNANVFYQASQQADPNVFYQASQQADPNATTQDNVIPLYRQFIHNLNNHPIHLLIKKVGTISYYGLYYVIIGDQSQFPHLHKKAYHPLYIPYSTEFLIHDFQKRIDDTNTFLPIQTDLQDLDTQLIATWPSGSLITIAPKSEISFAVAIDYRHINICPNTIQKSKENSTMNSQELTSLIFDYFVPPKTKYYYDGRGLRKIEPTDPKDIHIYASKWIGVVIQQPEIDFIQVASNQITEQMLQKNTIHTWRANPENKAKYFVSLNERLIQTPNNDIEPTLSPAYFKSWTCQDTPGRLYNDDLFLELSYSSLDREQLLDNSFGTCYHNKARFRYIRWVPIDNEYILPLYEMFKPQPQNVYSKASI